MKKHIPNILTILNLICGLISITQVLQYHLIWAALFIFIAAVFDYLDGTAARLLKAWSELGKQLDSLADLVSFGVAPGLIIFQLLSNRCSNGCNILERWNVIPFLALLIPVCSALRLAKFNIDLRQEVNFIGLPTPANAIFFASIPMILQIQDRIHTFIQLDFMVALFSNPRVHEIQIPLMERKSAPVYPSFSFIDSPFDLFDQCSSTNDPGLPPFISGIPEENLKKFLRFFAYRSTSVRNSAPGKPYVRVGLAPIPVRCLPSE